MSSKSLQLRDAFASEDSRVSRTVLFVDQAGSTAMKEKYPEATWLPSLGWLYDVATAIAMEEMPDVTVKYLGDGIMFVCDSDAATKAVTTAIKIQAAIKEANGAPGTKGIIDFYCSVGIATGWVRGFVTPTGSPDYVGTVADKARRLCDAASPQAIFIDRATGAAANMTRIESPAGRWDHRTPDEYQGDLQRAPLKGFDQPVEYYEILWDHQRYGLKSGPLTESADRIRQSNLQPMPTAPNAPSTGKQRGGREERHRGEVDRWIDKGFGFIVDPVTDEEFHFTRSALVYPEDINKVRKANTSVVFVAYEAPATGKKRRAGAVMVVGQYAEGVLVSLPEGKPYGWLQVRDAEGNRHPVYLRLSSGTATYTIGDVLSFRVGASDKGAYAEDVRRADDDEAAA